MPTPATPNPLAALARSAALLFRASNQATQLATLENQPAMSTLALGAQLTAISALDLLPPVGALPDVQDSGIDPVLLLQAAERELRTHPPEQFPPGTARIVIEVCDLIRDHRP